MSPVQIAERKETLLEGLKTAHTDDATFKEMIERCFAHAKLVDKDLSDALGVSRPTVTRWRNGVCAPHTALRKTVYDCLALLVQNS